jgi:hypothetical protein
VVRSPEAACSHQKDAWFVLPDFQDGKDQRDIPPGYPRVPLHHREMCFCDTHHLIDKEKSPVFRLVTCGGSIARMLKPTSNGKWNEPNNPMSRKKNRSVDPLVSSKIRDASSSPL